jgi:hypothetical protein
MIQRIASGTNVPMEAKTTGGKFRVTGITGVASSFNPQISQVAERLPSTHSPPGFTNPCSRPFRYLIHSYQQVATNQ